MRVAVICWAVVLKHEVENVQDWPAAMEEQEFETVMEGFEDVMDVIEAGASPELLSVWVAEEDAERAVTG